MSNTEATATEVAKKSNRTILNAGIKAVEFMQRQRALDAELVRAIEAEPDGSERDAMLILWAWWTYGIEHAMWYGLRRFKKNWEHRNDRANRNFAT